ncbi:MAG: hypothetical protein H6714_00925 [Myxococcales bacterium]|nr:hypothetical protein [Myxococcales bacterium]
MKNKLIVMATAAFGLAGIGCGDSADDAASTETTTGAEATPAPGAQGAAMEEGAAEGSCGAGSCGAMNEGEAPAAEEAQ